MIAHQTSLSLVCIENLHIPDYYRITIVLHPLTIKKVLLIDRAFRINSTSSGFHYDILNLKSVLQKNEFPLKLIDKSISKYLSNNVFKQKENEQMPLLESTKKRFYKIPYIGNFSIQTKKKLNNIVLKYCNPNTNIELLFSSFKISSLCTI